MPINAFRSWNDSPSVKGLDTDLATSTLKFNYALLGACFLGDDQSRRGLEPIYTPQQYAADRSALDRLLFIYYSDRLRAKIEDELRVFLEDRPERILKVDKKVAYKLPKDISIDSVRPLIDKAGDKLVQGSISDIQRRCFDSFGFSLLTDAELAFVKFVFALRNMFVHRGEKIDAKFKVQTKSQLLLGQQFELSSINWLSVQVIVLPSRIARRLSGTDSFPTSTKYRGDNV